MAILNILSWLKFKIKMCHLHQTIIAQQNIMGNHVDFIQKFATIKLFWKKFSIVAIIFRLKQSFFKIEKSKMSCVNLKS